MNVKFPATYLKALKIFAADEDIRYYLNGILVEASTDGAILVGTDGHRLGAFFVKQHLPRSAVVIVPSEMLRPLWKIKPQGEVTLTIGDDDVSISLHCEGATFTGKAIHGKYPNWRRVFPQKVSGEYAQFNPDYMADVGKACSLVGNGGWPTIGHNGQSGALLGFGGCPDFAGVLMPYRADPMTIPPEWARPKVDAPADEQTAENT